jgi:hypothetical protein
MIPNYAAAGIDPVIQAVRLRTTGQIWPVGLYDHPLWNQEFTLHSNRKTIASRFFYVCQSGWPALSTSRWEWILKGTFSVTLRDCWEIGGLSLVRQHLRTPTVIQLKLEDVATTTSF